MKRAISISVFLYLVSLLTSLAGSEIFGWLTLLLSTVYGVWISRSASASRDAEPRLGPAFFALGPDLALWALFFTALLAYFVNAAPDAKLLTILGQVRWVVLLYGLAWGVQWSGLKSRCFTPLAIVVCIVALHGIQMTFTGWDFIRGRPDVYLATEPGAGLQLFRASGFFTMPTNFAHAANMTLSFLMAALFVGLGQTRKQRWLHATAAGLLFLAIIFSFTRGAWISLFIAIIGLTGMVNRKWMAIAAGSLTACALIIVLMVPQFKQRAETMMDPQFVSNSERLELWNENLAIIKMHPWLGIGLNENERLADEYNAMIGNPGGKKGNAHNTYLQFLSGSGIFGLLAYLTLISTFMLMTWRLWKIVPQEEIWHRTLVLGAWGAQIALHVGGMTDCNFKNWQVNHQTMAIWAMIAYLSHLYGVRVHRFDHNFRS